MSLHVLLRHRLLRQPCGSEGVRSILMLVDVDDVAFPDLEVSIEANIDLDPASPTATDEVHGRHDVIASIEHVFNFQPMLGPGPEPRSSDAHGTVEAVGDRVVVLERCPFDLWVSEVAEHLLIVLERRKPAMHDLHVLPRHHLPPFPGKAFGGSTGLADVGVGRQSHEEAIGRPADGPSLPLMDLTIDADRATLLVDHRKHDPVVEDDELFDFEAKLGEIAEPFVQEATNCRSAFVRSARRPPVKERIGSKEAHYRVDVTLMHSLEDKARKLSQVGGRGLLRHRAWKYPADGRQRYAERHGLRSRERTRQLGEDRQVGVQADALDAGGRGAGREPIRS